MKIHRIANLIYTLRMALRSRVSGCELQKHIASESCIAWFDKLNAMWTRTPWRGGCKRRSPGASKKLHVLGSECDLQVECIKPVLLIHHELLTPTHTTGQTLLILLFRGVSSLHVIAFFPDLYVHALFPGFPRDSYASPYFLEAHLHYLRTNVPITGHICYVGISGGTSFL